MGLYACSGVLLIFRTTDFMKFEQTEEKVLEPGLNSNALGEQLKIRGFKTTAETETDITFAQGRYNKVTGEAAVTTKEYPKLVAKIVHLHKASTKSPLFFLNIAFGLTLLFFVVSAFLMFLPKVPQFKNGLKIAGAGFLFALVMVLFSG